MCKELCKCKKKNCDWLKNIWHPKFTKEFNDISFMTYIPIKYFAIEMENALDLQMEISKMSITVLLVDVEKL